MYSKSKLVLFGNAWAKLPIEYSQCSAHLEVNTLADWQKADAFLAKHKHKDIAYILNYQLKGLFKDYAFQTHSKINFPLALFLVFDVKNDFRHAEACFTQQNVELKSSLSKAAYFDKIAQIKSDIQQGEYYESNFCVEHFAQANIDADALFAKVCSLSKAPYSAYFKADNHHIISGSPEMFFSTSGSKIVSAPIKGTRPKGKTLAEDKALKNALINSLKERAENTMIVDLVRHDLSQIAEKNSVTVEALCALKSFETVHQLESSISAKLRPDVKFTEIIERLFPMGSMTGAPKIAAVKHSDALEVSPRCTYSGSLGVIEAGGNIRSSVLIRSFYYNDNSGYLSASVGGAITALSNIEEEYAECQTKLEMLNKALEM